MGNCAACGKSIDRDFSGGSFSSWRCPFCRREYCWSDSLKVRPKDEEIAGYGAQSHFDACKACVTAMIDQRKQQAKEDHQGDWWGIRSWYEAQKNKRFWENYRAEREWEAAGEQEL